jgi:integrase
MSLYKPKKSRNWWYKFVWNGEPIGESTKQTNKRVAEQIESARRTALAKGEVGIKERRATPTLSHFMRDSFIPFLDATKAEEPNTVQFYKARIENLLAWSKLAECNLDEIKAEIITAYIVRRQEAQPAISTINRELATLRRTLRLANKWGDLTTAPPQITLLDGEVCRERVLTDDEEWRYLSAATPLLRVFATIMLDCGLRPDEIYRLRWDENYGNNRVIVHTGKSKAARRSITVTPRVAALLEMGRTENATGWIFPAPTKSGRINHSSLKKQHRKRNQSQRGDSICSLRSPAYVPHPLGALS